MESAWLLAKMLHYMQGYYLAAHILAHVILRCNKQEKINLVPDLWM